MNANPVPQPARQRGKIAPEKLAHVVFRTTNSERLINWYRTVLEAEVALANPMISFLTYDEEHHRIAIAQIPGLAEAPGMSTGLEHVAFTYRNADDLFATYERLKDLGIEPYWTINHGPTLSFYYRDPDGNQIELQIDIFSDPADVNAWFASSDFPTNPIGVKFEPEDIIRRYRAGEMPARLFKRPVIDPSQVFAQLPLPLVLEAMGAPPPSAAAEPGNIDGTWNWHAVSSMGERKGSGTFKTKNDVLEGHWKGMVHDQPIVRGTWKNGKAHWELDIEQPFKGAVVFDATLSNGELAGTVVMGPMGKGTITLTRAS